MTDETVSTDNLDIIAGSLSKIVAGTLDRVIEMHVLTCMIALQQLRVYRKEHETNGRQCVMDISAWDVAVARDPRVSSDAQALIARGKAEGQAARDALAEKLKGCEQLLTEIVPILQRDLKGWADSYSNGCTGLVEDISDRDVYDDCKQLERLIADTRDAIGETP